MKKTIINISLVAVMILLTVAVFAQPGGIGGGVPVGGNPPAGGGAPIDGGITALLGGAAVWGYRRIKKLTAGK
ncbi:MAG: hypothetical protein U0T84_10715 [Chitinophagales bacterium]